MIKKILDRFTEEQLEIVINVYVFINVAFFFVSLILFLMWLVAVLSEHPFILMVVTFFISTIMFGGLIFIMSKKNEH